MKKLMKSIEADIKLYNAAIRGRIKLHNNITVQAGNTDGVIYITDGKDTIWLTQTVLNMMLVQSRNKSRCSINDRILEFLQG